MGAGHQYFGTSYDADVVSVGYCIRRRRPRPPPCVQKAVAFYRRFADRASLSAAILAIWKPIVLPILAHVNEPERHQAAARSAGKRSWSAKAGIGLARPSWRAAKGAGCLSWPWQPAPLAAMAAAQSP